MKAICLVCKKSFEANRVSAQFCSSTCRTRYRRNTRVSVSPEASATLPSAEKSVPVTLKDKQKELDDYLGSPEYAADIRGFVANHNNKTFFGGQTSNGYIHYELPNGIVVSAPVNIPKKKPTYQK